MASVSHFDPQPPGVLPPEEHPDVEHLVTEDDTPVDGFYSEKQMRLLTVPLYESWEGPGAGRGFLAAANVGLFFSVKEPPLVPDVMLSMDVKLPDDLFKKKNRSYFLWEYGKAPEAAIEVVSNTEGGELDAKVTGYARVGVAYYIVWDPMQFLGEKQLHVFVLKGRKYEENGLWFPEIGLGLTTWEGEFEQCTGLWLRWCYQDGSLVLTGKEKSERLAAQLRALGVEPENQG